MLTQHKWLIPVIISVVILVAGGAGFLLSRPQGNELASTVVVRVDRGTAESDPNEAIGASATFSLTSGYRVSEEQLRGMLAVEPEFAYTLSGSGKQWSLKPDTPLADNTVYTIRVNNAAGKAISSFAFQTRSDLLVRSVYPSDKSEYVDLNTGIEIQFNVADVDLSKGFEIKPSISGQFKTSGFFSTFVPDQPLSPDSIYRVTIKAGVASADGLVLKQDYIFSFETRPDDAQQEKETWRRLRLSGDLAETFLPGDPLVVEMNGGEDAAGQSFDMTLHAYPSVTAYARALRDYDLFYNERYGEKQDYVIKSDKLEKTLELSGELFSKQDSGRWYAILPEDLPEGHYLFTLTGKDANGVEQQVQKLLQVANLSVYNQSNDGDTLFWVNDPVTGGALADAVLLLEDEESGVQMTGQTLADGTARLMTGEKESIYLTINQGGKPIYFSKEQLSPQAEKTPLSEQFYTAIYTDREIYQPDDTIRVWGVVRPRNVTSTQPEFVYAALASNWPSAQIVRQKLTVAPDGTFSGTLPISGIRKNWYSLVISDGEEGEYSSKGMRVDQYTKPAYSIELSSDKPWYYSNDPVTFSVAATYFDGTPVAGGKLRLFCQAAGIDAEGATVELDAQGKATVTGKLDAQINLPENGNRRDWMPQNIVYSVQSSDEQDVNIYADNSLLVLPSKVAAQMEHPQNDQSKLTIRTAALDTAKLDVPAQPVPLAAAAYYNQRIAPDQFEFLAGAAADLPVTVLVHKSEYVQVQTGQYYDYVNKKSIPQYKNEYKESIVQTIPTKTVGGTVTLNDLPVAQSSNEAYWYEVRFDGGVYGEVCCLEYRWARYDLLDNTQKGFTFTKDNANGKTLKMNESFELELYENGAKIPNGGKVLYSVLQRKTLQTGIFTTDSFAMSMTQDLLPNAYIAGAYFDGKHVYQIDMMSIAYDYSEKTLKVEATADQPSYRPGDTAKITVKVNDAGGKPAAASVCIGVVDEAVFAIAEQELQLAGQLYHHIYYPSLPRNTSYKEYALEEASMMDTGGRGGGGGDAQIRKTFVDTVQFLPVAVDASGTATIEVKLPDNITGWRITAAAVTTDLQAGDSKSGTISTLPFYIQPIVTQTYLVGDDVVIAAKPITGDGAAPDAQVEYTAVLYDAAGTEVDRLTKTGAASAYTSMNFGKYEEGAYKVVLTAKQGEHSDGVEKTFSVMKQGITVPVIKTMPAEELIQLYSADYPVRVNLYDEQLAPFMEALAHLNAQDGERIEAAVAAYRARAIYRNLMPENQREPAYKPNRLEQLQQSDGGVALLPSGVSDPGATARILIGAPMLLDTTSACDYLQKVLQDPAATQDDRVLAYAGLAAAKQPILLDLKRMLTEKADSFTPAQKLYLGGALASLGDFEGAQQVYAGLSERLSKEGALYYMEGEGTAESRLQTSAAALWLTSLISNSDADSFARYLVAQDNVRSRTDGALYHLELLAYIENFKASDKVGNAKVSYTMTDGQTKELTLPTEGFEALAFDAQGLHVANLKVVSGKVFAAVEYTDYPNGIDTAKNDLVKISKTYTPVGERLSLASRVKVELEITFDPSAPAGCYNITDYIPSGMRFVSDIETGGASWYSNVEQSGQTVYTSIYRSELVEPDLGVPMPTAAEEKVIPDAGNGKDTRNHFTVTYYLSATLPGSFVTERAYITPNMQGIAAASDRGQIAIQE